MSSRDIVKAPFLTRTADRVLSPVIGKSLVVYLTKPAVVARHPTPGGSYVACGPPPTHHTEAGSSGMTTEEIRSAQVTIPEVPGILTGADVLATARAITEVQRPDGMIPWFEDGHCDPWNHVEAAMALTVCGLVDKAKAAYRWLVDRQLPDGSWFNYYRRDAVKDPRLDTQRLRVPGRRGMAPPPDHRGRRVPR